MRDREELAALDVGGSAERPIEVSSPAIIEGRARSTKCVQCGGAYHLDDHQAPSALLRVIAVTCQRCGVSRHLWFRIAPSEPN